MTLHPNVEALAPLIGTWKGEGTGAFPTITDFVYVEEITFVSTGKPFLAYQQRTWSPEGAPMHVETGYLRQPKPGFLDLVVALPTGHAEILEGPLVIDGDALAFTLEGSMLNATNAKQIVDSRRTYRMQDDAITFGYDMSYAGHVGTRHISSVLYRV